MYFLGIDIGGTVTKAGIYDALGQEICVSEDYANILSAKPGFTERNMDALWLSVCKVVQSAISQSGLSNAQIKGIGFSSHGKGLYAIDKNGDPVRNGIISSDTRALKIVQDWQKAGIDQQAYPKGLQQLWTGHPVSLLAWIKQEEPENYEKIDAILMVHDYIRFKLTGEITAEITNISGSNIYNQKTGDYDSELMQLFGIPEMENHTARVITSSEQAGGVTIKAAKETGLLAGTAVYGGLFDVVAAALSSGVADKRILSAVAGTWSIATSVVDELNIDQTNNYPYIWGKYCTGNQYFVHEGSPTSASNLAWMIKQFFNNDQSVYQKFNQMLADKSTDNLKYADEDALDLIFLPYLFGSNQASNLKGGFYGMSGHHTQDDMIAAMYRGIIYSHLIHQDRILKLNPDIEKIRFTGGPSQSEAWMQMMTDAGGLNLEVVDIKQAGCQAAAMSAAVGYGVYKNFSDAITANVPKTLNYAPNRYQNEYLRRGYAKFIALSETLAKLE